MSSTFSQKLALDSLDADAVAREAFEADIDQAKQRLKASIAAGLADIENGDVSPFDEDYKSEVIGLGKML